MLAALITLTTHAFADHCVLVPGLPSEKESSCSITLVTGTNVYRASRGTSVVLDFAPGTGKNYGKMHAENDLSRNLIISFMLSELDQL